MKSIFRNLLIKLLNAYYNFAKPNKNLFIHKNVPFYSQWESINLVDKIILKNIDAFEDPKWKNSGAMTKREYLNWSWNICGMACLKMILKYFINIEIPIITLSKKCLKYGGYKINTPEFNKGNYKQSIDGLMHKEFAIFVNSEFNLKCKIINPLVTGKIIKELENKNLIIASVDQKIRKSSDSSTKKGGHLVLVVGYDLTNQIFYIHNPSGFYNQSQIYYKISFSDFSKFFSNRGFAITKD